MNLENIGLSSKNLEPSRIRQLDLHTSNQIAAGEVIERPSSALKELVENSIDAGANSIDIVYANGGKSFLSVKDNGHGINKEDLSLALSRHATSKISMISDLANINSLGFRGEALASIGAVAELTIKSRFAEEGEAFEISSSYGEVKEVKPSQYLEGTLIEIKNLFQSVPARLKFLKTDRAEGISILEVVKKLSLSNPEISFKLYEIKKKGNPREILRLTSSTDHECLSLRIKEVLKNAFMENSHQVDFKSENIKITGYISSPTFVSGNASNCHFFVNGRFVRDRYLLSYLRMAYGDLLEKSGFPSAVLFFTIPSGEIDVNVHPSKMEIKFKKLELIRQSLKGAVRQSLDIERFNSRNHLSKQAYSYFRKHQSFNGHQKADFSNNQNSSLDLEVDLNTSMRFDKENDFTREIKDLQNNENNMLGTPKAHLFKNFIVAQNDNELVIVDQHAAHERILYEKLKTQKYDQGITVQDLLVPEIVEFTRVEVDAIIEKQSVMKQLGLEIERFGPASICIRGVPALLGEVCPKTLLIDLLEDLEDLNTLESLENKIDKVFSSMACHGSVRSGRILKYEEMDNLLREMEKTPNSDQCNHGRPTYLKLDLEKINKLFGRT